MNHIYLDYLLEINGQACSINLLPMGIKGLDVIVGMDCMGDNNTKILCGKRMVSTKTSKGEKLYVYGNWDNKLPCVISAFKHQMCLLNGCKSFLACVLDGKKVKEKIGEVNIVTEFSKVFPDDLSGLPPTRQVDFSIDLVSGVNHMARASYRLALTKMRAFIPTSRIT